MDDTLVLRNVEILPATGITIMFIRLFLLKFHRTINGLVRKSCGEPFDPIDERKQTNVLTFLDKAP